MSIKIRHVFGPNKRSQKKYISILDDLDKRIFPDDDLEPKTSGHWWIAFDGDKPVGFAGLDTTRLKDKSVLSRAGVLKEYRGLGIHKRLILVRERMAKKLGFSRMVAYTSHPNIPSSNNLIKAGYIRYGPSIEWGIKNAIYFSKQL